MDKKGKSLSKLWQTNIRANATDLTNIQIEEMEFQREATIPVKLKSKPLHSSIKEEFSKIFKYSGVLPFSAFPRCQCVYTHQAGRKPALQQNWQSWEKSQNFKEKTQYLMNTLYMPRTWKANQGQVSIGKVISKQGIYEDSAM